MDHPAAAWGPACGLQLANWPVEEEPPAAEAYWAPPATGFAVDIDMFGTCGLPWPYVPAESSGGQQLVGHEHYYCSPVVASQKLEENSGGKQLVVDHNPQSGETTKIVVSNDSHARDVFDQVAEEFKDYTSKLMQKNMHRYPAVLGALDKSYTVPKVVAMGPYHHHQPHLKKAEKVKHMAAIQCVRESGHLLEEVYGAVTSAADDKDVMAGIGYDDFRHMMFFDACFLGQYILMQTDSSKVDQSLSDFFGPNRKDIRQDITLLENQLPWKVLQMVMGFSSASLTRDPFVGFLNIYKGFLQDQRPTEEGSSAHRLTLDENYRPPHLLGFLRHNSVGKISEDVNTTKDTDTHISISISAMQLAEMRITLRANISTTDLVVMGLQQEGSLFAELSLVPLSLDHNRASYLVNMAALELCTVRSFVHAPVEDSAVCSYLQLLAMLVHREEDVQELRAKGVLQGGGGLTNEQALSFFTSLQGQRRGKLYRRIMRDIEGYKESRRMQTKLYSFFYNNRKTIAAGATGISVVGGIIGAIMSIKGGL